MRNSKATEIGVNGVSAKKEGWWKASDHENLLL